MTFQLKKDSDGRANSMDQESKMRVAERQNTIPSDEDENSDYDDDAEMSSDMKDMSVTLKRNVTITGSEEASVPSKKFAVQNCALPEVVIMSFIASISSLLQFFWESLSGLCIDVDWLWFNLQIVKPCGRINSCMVVGKDTLYIYGGMMEINDQEITLDDLYALNLNKLDEWKCIIQVLISYQQGYYLFIYRILPFPGHILR